VNKQEASNSSVQNIQSTTSSIYLYHSLSLSFLLIPLWRIWIPWNALFHFSFLTPRQSIGLLGRGISPPQGCYLHMTAQTQNESRQTSMTLLGFEPTIPVNEGISCFRSRGHCDWPYSTNTEYIVNPYFTRSSSAFFYFLRPNSSFITRFTIISIQHRTWTSPGRDIMRSEAV
jgi:hypothetical protein